MNAKLSMVLMSLLISGCGWSENDAMMTVLYEVPVQLAIESEPKDLFANQNDSLTKQRLIAEGISFPEGSEILTGMDFVGFGMRNTKVNHDRLETWLNEEFGDGWFVRY